MGWRAQEGELGGHRVCRCHASAHTTARRLKSKLSSATRQCPGPRGSRRSCRCREQRWQCQRRAALSGAQPGLRPRASRGGPWRVACQPAHFILDEPQLWPEQDQRGQRSSFGSVYEAGVAYELGMGGGGCVLILSKGKRKRSGAASRLVMAQTLEVALLAESCYDTHLSLQ